MISYLALAFNGIKVCVQKYQGFFHLHERNFKSFSPSYSIWKETRAMLDCDSEADNRHIYILIATLTSKPEGYIEMFTI